MASTSKPGGEPEEATQATAEEPVGGHRRGRRETADAELAPGSQVARYRIEERLGKGGMGVVYRAFDPELQRRVAIKLLRVSSKSPESRELRRARLLREAQALAQLQHPNVIAVHDVGTHGDDVFVAMELVDGVTLRDWLAERHRRPDDVVAVFLQAGAGLAAAHAAGLVHRDFKPENVIVGRDGRARVLDFGLARIAGGESGHTPSSDDDGDAPGDSLRSALTQEGLVMGTPLYMSPEQHLGRAVDARSDQFGFCVALWEALAGEPPFGRGKRDELRARVFAGRAPALPAGARLPRRLRRALERGLAIDAAKRWPSMDALGAELGRDPLASRRRAGVALGVLAPVALAAWALLRPAPSVARPCAGGAELLGAAWNDARRQAVRAAFGATRLPYAEATWTEVSRRLDDWQRAWVAGRKEACMATMVRREQSTEVMDLRMACLDTRRRELGALTTLFADADPVVLARAVDAAAGLTSPEACADVAALRRGEGAPPDPAVRARVDTARAALVEPRTMHAAGRYQEGLAKVRPLVAEAQALGYRPLVAEALYLQAQLESDLGQPDDAGKSLDGAAFAAEAAGADEVLLDALLLQLSMATDEHAPGEAGERVARRAEALVTRLGDPPALRGQLLYQQSRLAETQGKTDEAYALARESVAQLERAWGRGQPAGFQARRWLGSCLSFLGRDAEARTEQLALLADMQKAFGADHPEVAAVLLSLSIVAGNLTDYDHAVSYAEASLRVREAALGPDHPDVALTLITLGVSRMWKNDDDDARRDFERAIAILDKNPATAYMATAAMADLGDLELKHQRFREAERWYREALAIDEKELGPDHSDLGMDLSGLAHALLGEGRAAEAAPLFERALEIMRGEPRATAEAEFGLARALVSLGRERGRALELAQKARVFFASDASAHAPELRELDTWLAKHGGGR